MIIESGSSLSTFLSCPKKYDYKYNKLLDPTHYSSALSIGIIVHAIAEENHLGVKGSYDKAVAEIREKYKTEAVEKDINYATAIGISWSTYWNNSLTSLGNQQFSWLAVEREWRFNISSETKDVLVGKSDGYLQHKTMGKCFLYELKTATDRDRESYINQLQSNSQINNNVIALVEDGLDCDGVVYDIIWKPSLRQKQSETDEGFQTRLINTMTAEPDKYFTRHLIYRNKGRLMEHVRDLRQQYSALAHVKANGFFRNTGSCKMYNTTCAYYEACIDNNLDLEKFFAKRERKLPELSIEIQKE